MESASGHQVKGHTVFTRRLLRQYAFLSIVLPGIVRPSVAPNNLKLTDTQASLLSPFSPTNRSRKSR